jgi:hypothetical protein
VLPLSALFTVDSFPLVSEEEKRSFILLTPEDPSCFAAGHAFPGIAEKRSRMEMLRLARLEIGVGLCMDNLQ